MADRRTTKASTVWSGVDWVSGTLQRAELDDQVWLRDCFEQLYAVQALGNVIKRRSLLGFDGWESGGCFVGSSETAHYAQFAGKYANDAYKAFDHPKVHISRLDIQVTVQYETELLKEGRYQYARAIHYNKGLPEQRRRTINLFAGHDGGDTVYLGSPSSDQRGRLYNKHKQSGERAYERSWRYEVVYRNEYAISMFRHVLAADNAASSVIVSNVVAWYSERGVTILDLGIRGGNIAEVPKSPKTDVERKIRWIKNQVVPTIRKLAQMGYAEELMEAIAEAIAAARNEQL